MSILKNVNLKDEKSLREDIENFGFIDSIEKYFELLDSSTSSMNQLEKEFLRELRRKNDPFIAEILFNTHYNSEDSQVLKENFIDCLIHNCPIENQGYYDQKEDLYTWVTDYEFHKIIIPHMTKALDEVLERLKKTKAEKEIQSMENTIKGYQLRVEKLEFELKAARDKSDKEIPELQKKIKELKKEV